MYGDKLIGAEFNNGRSTYHQRSGSTTNPMEYNVALLGMLGAGKSALTVKYLTKRYIMEYDPYLEDVYTKHDIIDHQEVIIRVMDTYEKESPFLDGGDSERYMKWADGIIIVYSITSRQSFDEARRYLELMGSGCPVALVGNKTDLDRYRQVSKAEAKALASKHETLFYETTAAEDFHCVQQIFHAITREIQRENERHMTLPPLFITEERQCSTTNSLGRQAFKRAKSPKLETKVDHKDIRPGTKKSSTSFRLFNKSFKIFN